MALRGKKDTWTTKFGVIMAVAGSAIGLGNFLRFPGQAASNGGGAFMEDEFNLDRKKAVGAFLIMSFVLSHLSILFLAHGVVDELDFWGGTFCLVLFATVETILFGWVFGMERAWEEIHHGADITIPRFYKFIIKYITPLFLFFILGFWVFQKGRSVLFMEGLAPADRPYILFTRLLLLVLMAALAVMIKISWRNRRLAERAGRVI